MGMWFFNEKRELYLFKFSLAGMTGFEPAISALTGPHVSRYTTSPFRLAFRNLLLSRSTFSILAYHLCRVKGFAKFVTFNFPPANCSIPRSITEKADKKVHCIHHDKCKNPPLPRDPHKPSRNHTCWEQNTLQESFNR